MQSSPSVHDNLVYAYVVDCEKQMLVLHTAYRDREPQEFTDVVFRGVVAHRLENVLTANILLDVVEIPIDELVAENAELLRESWRYGWPPFEYAGDLGALVTALRNTGITAYSVASSYGLCGWVLALSGERVQRTEPARLR